jgi:hypothetical protein
LARWAAPVTVPQTVIVELMLAVVSIVRLALRLVRANDTH